METSLWFHEVVPVYSSSSGITVVLFLLPLVLIMAFIRWREERLGVPRLEALSPGHKAWLFISSLASQSGARVLQALPASVAVAYCQAGCTLPERAECLGDKVIASVLESLPEGIVTGQGDAPWNLNKANELASSQADVMAQAVQQLFPADIAAPVAEEKVEADTEADTKAKVEAEAAVLAQAMASEQLPIMGPGTIMDQTLPLSSEEFDRAAVTLPREPIE